MFSSYATATDLLGFQLGPQLCLRVCLPRARLGLKLLLLQELGHGLPHLIHCARGDLCLLTRAGAGHGAPLHQDD